MSDGYINPPHDTFTRYPIEGDLVVHIDPSGNSRLYCGVMFHGMKMPLHRGSGQSPVVYVDGAVVSDRPIACVMRGLDGSGVVVRFRASYEEVEALRELPDPMAAHGFADVEYLHGQVEVLLSGTELPKEPTP